MFFFYFFFPPFCFISTPPNSSGWKPSATSITLGVTSANGIASARYNWDAAASATVGTVYINGTVISSPVGSHQLYTWAQDNAGNTNTAGPIGLYQYDDTNPSTVTFTSLSPNPNNTGSHLVNWTDSTDTQSGLVGYDVWQSLNGGAYQYQASTAAGVSQWTAPGIDAGTYTYQIVARDNATRTSTSAPSVAVIVDKTAPALASCAAGADQGSPTTAVTVRFTEQLNGTPSDPTCASPAWSNKSYSAIGTTTLKVRTCDAAGNASAVTTPAYAYTITSSSPISFTFTPPNSSGWKSSATSITLGVTSANGIASARYNWDAAASSTVGTGYTNGTVISSPVGSHQLYAWAQDNAGNTSTAGPISLYQFDNSNPSVVTFTSLSPNPNNTGSHLVNWTDATDTYSGLAGYDVYQSSGGPYIYQASTSAGVSQWTAPGIAAGTYTYQIVARDQSDPPHTSTSLPSVAVIVDKGIPEVASCAPGDGTYQNSVSVTCAAGADTGSPTTAVSVRYTVGATTPADPTCSSSTFTNPTVYSATRVLKVRTCDLVGNASSVTTYTYTITASSPINFTFTPSSSSGWKSSATSITLGVTSANGIASARYNWDAAASSTVGTVYTHNTAISSPVGSHQLYAWAQDNVGNTNTAGPIGLYQFDNSDPSVVTFTSLSPNPNNTGSHLVNWTDATDTYSGLAGYDVYQSSGGPYIYQASTVYNPLDPPASSQWTAPGIAAGTYTYQIVAREDAARTSTSLPSVAVIVDKTAPALASCAPGTGTYQNSVAVICTAGADQGSPTTAVTVRFTEQLNGTPSDPTCASPAWSNKSYSAIGTTTLKVRTCDAAG